MTELQLASLRKRPRTRRHRVELMERNQGRGEDDLPKQREVLYSSLKQGMKT